MSNVGAIAKGGQAREIAAVKANKMRVQNGRLVGEAPEGLPEGAEVELRIIEPGEDLSDAELADLNAGLEDAWRSVRSGDVRAAADVLRDTEANGRAGC